MPKILIVIVQKVLSLFGLVLTRNMPVLGRSREINLNSGVDYVRLSSIDLVAFEINEKKVEGNIAELGVFQGEFATKLNTLFPNKKLYLFDTFQGFDSRDITKEVQGKYSRGTQDFSNTSIELVLGKMKYPSNCIVKKGFFPETATNVNDSFCFVSIDTDLYEPIYQGLKYFYPRLVKGGYIFIHDFNNVEYVGAKQAVRTFCKEQNISYFPLSDNWGSAIISK